MARNSTILLLILLLDATLAFRVDEAASRASALLSAKPGLAGSARSVVLSGRSTNAVEDSADEISSKSSPGPGEAVTTDASVKTSLLEVPAANDEAGTESVSLNSPVQIKAETHVIRDAVTAWKNMAIAQVAPER